MMRSKGWGHRVGQAIGVLITIAIVVAVIGAIVVLGLAIASGIRSFG